MAVVLFIGNSLNLNAFSSQKTMEEYPGCFEYADRWATIIGFWQGLDHYDEYVVFTKLYDNCMSQ